MKELSERVMCLCVVALVIREGVYGNCNFQSVRLSVHKFVEFHRFPSKFRICEMCGRSVGQLGSDGIFAELSSLAINWNCRMVTHS